MMTGSPARSVIGVPLGISRAGTSRETVASFLICMGTPLRSSGLGVGAFRLRRDGRPVALERRLQRVPGERRALDAHGVLAHAREHLELAELRGARPGLVGHAILAGDELVEAGEERLGFRARLALDALGH